MLISTTNIMPGQAHLFLSGYSILVFFFFHCLAVSLLREKLAVTSEIKHGTG